jgi:hypothetical protein
MWVVLSRGGEFYNTRQPCETRLSLASVNVLPAVHVDRGTSDVA